MSGSITGPEGKVLQLVDDFERNVGGGIVLVRPIIDDIVAQVSEFGDQTLATEFVIELMTGRSTQSPESIRNGMIDYDISGYISRQLAVLRQG